MANPTHLEYHDRFHSRLANSSFGNYKCCPSCEIPFVTCRRGNEYIDVGVEGASAVSQVSLTLGLGQSSTNGEQIMRYYSNLPRFIWPIDFRSSRKSTVGFRVRLARASPVASFLSRLALCSILPMPDSALHVKTHAQVLVWIR